MAEATEWKLPPFMVERVMATASQTVDWGLSLLGVPQLWSASEGEGTRAVVLDTGQPDHPDLLGATFDAKDFTHSRSGPKDQNGHSTHCGGIIGARNNDIGVIGVAPKSKIGWGKVLGDNGSGTNRGIYDGLHWAIDVGADVVSMSLGSPYPDEMIREGILDCITHNILVVCAIGNSGPEPDSGEYPGRWDECISVAAMNVEGKIANFSSRWKGVTVAAPGEKVLSTYLNGGLAVLSGTSMSTPFVVGVILLMLAKHRNAGGATPANSQKAVMEHLRRTATDKGPVGPDPSYGWGIVNPGKFLEPTGVPEPGLSLADDDFTAAGKAKLKKAGLSRFSININP